MQRKEAQSVGSDMLFEGCHFADTKQILKIAAKTGT